VSDISKTPIWYWIICLTAITWNGVGVLAYLGEAYMTAEQFSKLPSNLQEAYNNRPSWVTAAFAIAVFAGLLGSVLLLLKKKAATPVLIISLLAVITQHTYSFLIAKLHNIVGTFNIAMAGVVLIIAIALVLFARSRNQLGWLS